MRRREFLTAGLAPALVPPLLGPDRVRISRFAMGTGTRGYAKSSAQTRSLGIAGLAGLLRYGYERGLTLWDAADGYGSHPHLREALRSVPREKVAVLTKTRARTAAEMRADLDRFRRELDTDYLDILLLHAMTSQDWPTEHQGAMEALAEARDRGIVRTHGCSCHSLAALRTAARTEWVRVALAHTGVATITDVLRQMKASGKGVLGMKIFGGGKLPAAQALAFASRLDCVDAFTVGFESRDQIASLLQQTTVHA